MAKLTVKFIEAIERRVKAGEQVPEYHSDGEAGLNLRVRASGHMSFVIRKRPFKLHTLGPVALGLPEARRLAREALAEMARGVDPAERKRAEQRAAERADTFEKVVGHFLEDHVRPHLRSAPEVERVLRRDILPQLGKTPLAEVTTPSLRDLLRAKAKNAPRQAGVMYTILSKFFRWAHGSGYVTANVMFGLPKPSKEVSRDRVLSDAELRMVWNAADRLGYPFAPIVKLLALTGQRKSEIAEGVWSEIDLQAGVWSLPPARTKNARPHDFPLSAQSIEILQSLPRFDGSDLLFTSNGKTAVSGFSKAKDLIDKAIAEQNGGEPIPHWIFHDLRRSCATNLGKLNFPPHVIEAVLNHRSGAMKGVAGTYNRHCYDAEMREALDAWGRRLELIVSGEDGDNVVALPKRGRA